MQKYNKWRRDRWVTRVVRLGHRIDELYSSRAVLRPDAFPNDTAYIDAQIDFAEDARDRLITRIKETA